MKRPSSYFNIITLYYLLTYIFHFIKLQSFIKDIFIAPLYFIIPAGFGLLVFSIFNIHRKLLKTISGTQLILSAAFLGFLVISLIYTELNNHGILASAFPYVYPAVSIMSLAGFYRVREMLRAGETFRQVFSIFSICLPFFLLVYYFQFTHFSPYPLRDIFMETHFMKGALEFSKYHIINIATGDTYFHLLQVHTGILHNFFGYDLINSQWILPALLFVMYFLSFYCFYSAFIKDRLVLTAAMGLNTIFTSLMFSNSNNSYLIILTVLFFSVLVRVNREQSRLLPMLTKLSLLCGLSIIFFLNREVPSYEKTMLPYLISYLVLMAVSSFWKDGRLVPVMFLILLELIAPPYHRAASLYIPLTIALYALYFVCFQWHYPGGPEKKRALLNKVLISSIAVIPVIIILEILITSGLVPVLTRKAQELLNPLFLFIVNQRISDNQGVIGTTAELVRFVPPIVFLVSTVIIFNMYRNRKTFFVQRFTDNYFQQMFFCIISLLYLMMFYYSPLPNIHRLLVFPVLMVFAFMGFLFKYFYEYYLTVSKKPYLLAGAVAIYTLAAKFIYDLPWTPPHPPSPYIPELAPITYIGWTVIAVSLTALFITRKTAVISILTALLLISGLSLDRFNMVTKLYGNAYGYEFSEPKVISHYTSLELAAAEQLGVMIGDPANLMFSDPSTLGIFESRTGINGFYTFSNLGLMLDVYSDALKKIIRNVFPDIQENNGILNNKHPLNSEVSDYTKKNMDIMLMLAEFCDKHKGAVPEAGYTIQTILGNPFELGSFDYDYNRWATEYKDRIYWILNEKTIRWAYEHEGVGYYPMNKPFSENYIKDYILPYFDVILNSEDTILVLKLK